MRKITAGLFISLDSVVEEPDQRHFPYFNDEMGAAVDATFGSANTFLFGRKTYDSFAEAWPEREVAGGEDSQFAKLLGAWSSLYPHWWSGCLSGWMPWMGVLEGS